MREYVTAENGEVADDSDLLLTPKRRLGARLADARRVGGMTQAELAGSIGRSESLVAAVEAGRRRATDDHLIAVSNVLGMSAHIWISTRDVLESEARRAGLLDPVDGHDSPANTKLARPQDLHVDQQVSDEGRQTGVVLVEETHRQRLLAEVVQGSRDLDVHKLERLVGYLDALSNAAV